MKRTRILSGVLAVAVLIAVLCTSVVGALASESTITVTTSTVYNVNNPSLVTVTSKIIGVEPEDQITYLAYDDPEGDGPYADGTNTNIIFVDQLESEEYKEESGKYYRQFTYTTEASKINSTVIRFGAQKTDVSSVEGNDTNPDLFAYNVKLPEDGSVYLYVKNTEGGWEVPGKNSVIQGEVKLVINPPANKIAAEAIIKIDNNEKKYILAPDANGSAELLINVNGDLTVTPVFFDAAVEGEANISDGVNFNKTGGTDLSGSEKTAVAFSTVTVPKNTKHEFGVLLYFNDAFNTETIDDLTSVEENTVVTRDENTIYKFRAIAATDGKFAVKLVDDRGEVENALSGTFYLRPYLIYGEDDQLKLGEAVPYNAQ